MDETLATLEGRKVRTEGYVRAFAKSLRRELGVRRVVFLMADGPDGDFAPGDITRRTIPRLTSDETRILFPGDGRDIVFPKQTLQPQRSGVFDQRLVISLRKKMRAGGILALMPIHFDSKLLCLVAFRDTITNTFIAQHGDRLRSIQLQIEATFSNIVLYNQALERILQEYATP